MVLFLLFGFLWCSLFFYIRYNKKQRFGLSQGKQESLVTGKHGTTGTTRFSRIGSNHDYCGFNLHFPED